MSLKGTGTRKAVPYIPEVERGIDVPTIFWIFPKNMQGTYQSLELYSKAAVTTGRGNRTINPRKMFEADVQDFLSFCEKVQNYEFSNDFSDLQSKGLMALIEDEATRRLIVSDIDPQVFQEVQNAASDWDRLEKGKQAYEEYLAATKRT